MSERHVADHPTPPVGPISEGDAARLRPPHLPPELGTTAPGELSIVEILNVFLRRRYLIVLLPAVLVAAAAASGLARDRTYTASAAFTPQPSAGGPSAVAALGLQFGITLPARAVPDSPEFYAGLVRTRTVLRDVVETEYTVAHGDDRRTANLIELFGIGIEDSALARETAIERLRRQLRVRVQRETGVVNLSVSSVYPELPEAILGRVLELVNEFNLERRRALARSEDSFIDERLAEANSELMAAESRLEEFLRRNRQFRDAPDLLFEHGRLERDVAMKQQLYTSLVQAQQQARLEMARASPVITLLENPAGSTIPESRGTLVRMLIALFIGLILAILIALGLELISRARSTDAVAVGEFEVLREAAVDDIRRLGRWAGRLRR
jgi:uncharacterized protein involved in exopolysaccharide biosynthesis